MALKNLLKKALGNSFVWRLFVRLLAYPDSHTHFITNYLKLTPGMTIVDLGCGTAHILEFLPQDCKYYGVDSNPEYITFCKEKYGARGNFHCIEIEKVPSLPFSADTVLALGVLHHLTEEEALHLCKLAHNTLHSGGRLVTLDGCYTPNQSWLQRWLLNNDRGKFVRNKAGYHAIVSKNFTSIEQHVVRAYMRLPYTHNIMICTK